MPKWEYKVTVHSLPSLQCDEQTVIECDQEGGCFVSLACRGKVAWLEQVLGEKGWEGWELVQSGYHGKELFCIWKRPLEPGEKG